MCVCVCVHMCAPRVLSTYLRRRNEETKMLSSRTQIRENMGADMTRNAREKSSKSDLLAPRPSTTIKIPENLGRKVIRGGPDTGVETRCKTNCLAPKLALDEIWMTMASKLGKTFDPKSFGLN